MTNLRLPLFLTRLSIAAFLAPWWIKKAMNIEMTKTLFADYYKVSALPDAIAYGIGGLGILLLLAFLFGFKKRISYGLVFAIHLVGTLFTIPYLIPGIEGFNILFLAAIPTTAAMFLLYLLREQDTLLSVDSMMKRDA